MPDDVNPCQTMRSLRITRSASRTVSFMKVDPSPHSSTSPIPIWHRPWYTALIFYLIVTVRKSWVSWIEAKKTCLSGLASCRFCKRFHSCKHHSYVLIKKKKKRVWRITVARPSTQELSGQLIVIVFAQAKLDFYRSRSKQNFLSEKQAPTIWLNLE